MSSFMLLSSVNDFILNRVGYTHGVLERDRKVIAIYVFSPSDVKYIFKVWLLRTVFFLALHKAHMLYSMNIFLLLLLYNIPLRYMHERDYYLSERKKDAGTSNGCGKCKWQQEYIRW
jgi:hypothetical protein